MEYNLTMLLGGDEVRIHVNGRGSIGGLRRKNKVENICLECGTATILNMTKNQMNTKDNGECNKHG
jgi:hypothetical protein